MSNATQKELVDLVNGLSNEDIRKVMEIISDRVDVYVGLVGNRCVMGEIESAVLNGTSVQVNLELDYDLGELSPAS